jgi:hypothetical protein
MRFFIVGLGKFGRLALDKLSSSFPNPLITVVEQDPMQTVGIVKSNISVVYEDAVTFLIRPHVMQRTDWIIPMVPFHLAASFLLAGRYGICNTVFPESTLSIVPNPHVVNASNIYCSKSDFLCPDECHEGDLCTVTGKPRNPLYLELERIDLKGFTIIVLRSVQILAGVGGYQVADLLSIIKRITPGKYIIGTSCKCHAILTAIER